MIARQNPMRCLFWSTNEICFEIVFANPRLQVFNWWIDVNRMKRVLCHFIFPSLSHSCCQMLSKAKVDNTNILCLNLLILWIKPIMKSINLVLFGHRNDHSISWMEKVPWMSTKNKLANRTKNAKWVKTTKTA